MEEFNSRLQIAEECMVWKRVQRKSLNIAQKGKKNGNKKSLGG